MAERRSPHLILGLPFGASRSEATRAFARATRRLRTVDSAPFDIEDLNWALHEIEHASSDPAINVDEFRVPADPDVYDVPEAHGLLNPHVRPLPRCSEPTDRTTLLKVHDRLVMEVAEQTRTKLKEAGLPEIHLVRARRDP